MSIGMGGHQSAANSGAPSVLIAFDEFNVQRLQEAIDSVPGKYLKLK